MVHVPSQESCCYLSARTGAVMISIIGFVGGGFVAATDWLVLDDHARPHETVAMYIQISTYASLAVLSLFGLVASIMNHPQLVRLYSRFLIVHLSFNIASGIFSVYPLYQENLGAVVTRCLNGSTDDFVKDVCSKMLAIEKVIQILIFVERWLIELYGLSIVADYSGKLEDEHLSTENPAFLDTEVPFIPYLLSDPNRHVFPASKEASGYNAV